jgi:general secretion pathway protein D
MASLARGRACWLRHAAGLLLYCALALVVTIMLPATPARAADDTVTINFVDADIDSVAAAIGKITGRNFVLDPRVKGKINIVSASPVPVSAVYDIFLSALRLQGFTAVDSGNVTKILPEALAKMQGGAAAPQPASGDRLVTRVYSLKYASASELVPVLRPIISPNNTIAVYATKNALVITDYAENLRRIERIIKAVDRPGDGEPVVLPLRHASASDVAQTVSKLLVDDADAAGKGGAADARKRVSIAADVRTNSVIVRSDNPALVARVRSTVRQLDEPTGAAGNIHVVYLKNADATQVAKTLRAILTGQSPAPEPSRGAPTGAMQQGLSVTAGLGAGSSGAAGFGGASAEVASSTSPSAIAGGAIVQADTASNAVIVRAPDAIFANLKGIIEKLDVRRAQVFVEALIVEIAADLAAEFGVQWQFLQNPATSGTQVFGGTNFGARGSGNNIIQGSLDLGSLGRGLNLGVIKGTIDIPGIGTITNLAALARALETKAHADILSTPNLLTLDNEEARIVVGQNVPFITGQYAQTGGAPSVTPFQTIERQDVGLLLRIKPQISEGGTVRLQIYQELSNVEDNTNPAGIVTNKRSVESIVLVDDGQIIVLGGLMQDRTVRTVEQLPVLGDIPLIGELFRYETRAKEKRDLMVFLRPVVLRDSASYKGLTSDRYQQMIGAQEKSRMPHHLFLPDIEVPRLPSLEPEAPAAPAPR